ncbi:MAG: hypothetical protein J7507_04905 [Pseudoxanthomonas sp.]|nr:hypothetical protein [Pseudoxanthomonas sp.]
MIVDLPVVDSVLERHAERIAADLPAYRNHVYRLINLMDAMAPIGANEYPAVATAAVFHDIGLWTAGTWDYLPPSVAAAEQWLREAGQAALVPLVRAMIENHHKLLPCPAGTDPRVENFRRADWCDVSLGLRRGGVPAARYRQILGHFPAHGFHRRLLALGVQLGWRRPWRPLPMFRL